MRLGAEPLSQYPVPLTEEQLSGFLSRNPGYRLPTWLWIDVPSWGHIVQDSELGSVLVFVDAHGDGQFRLGVSPGMAQEIEKPTYNEDPRWLEDPSWLKPFKDLLGSAAGLALLGGLVYLAIRSNK